jgi:hypothetical protein
LPHWCADEDSHGPTLRAAGEYPSGVRRNNFYNRVKLSKKLIIEKLGQFNKPFVDLGMGVQLSDDALGGIVRVTTSTEKKRDHVPNRVSFGTVTKVNEYGNNIQIADLNALNAALAVIKWKKLYGFYRDLKYEHHSQYSIDTNLLLNEERGTDGPKA